MGRICNKGILRKVYTIFIYFYYYIIKWCHWSIQSCQEDNRGRRRRAKELRLLLAHFQVFIGLFLCGWWCTLEELDVAWLLDNFVHSYWLVISEIGFLISLCLFIRLISSLVCVSLIRLHLFKVFPWFLISNSEMEG